MLVLTRNIFITSLISVVTTQTIEFQSNSQKLNYIAPLIEAQSMGRIVNRPNHGIGFEADDESKSSNTVVFEGMLKDSQLPHETYSTRIAEAYEKSKEDQGTLSSAMQHHFLSGDSLTTLNSVILNQKQDYVTNPALFYNNQNVHIHHHHHHYVTLNKNKKNSLDEYTESEKSSKKHSEPVISTMPFISSPYLFTLESQVQIGSHSGDKINNLTNLDQSPQKPQLSYDKIIPIDIRKSDKPNEALPLFENNSKDPLDDQGKTEPESLLTLKISTLSPSDNDYSEYGVPLN